MVLNLVECFLGTKPIGDTCKLEKGEVEKGPVAPGVSPTAPIADVLVPAHISGALPKLIVVNAGASA